MKRTKQFNLNIELKDIKDISYFNWDGLKLEFNFSCNFQELTQIKLIDDSVLYILFQNGDLRLDITKSKLKNLCK
ncbi:MAG: hypothetical protein ACTSRI_14710 [Promethearchaeota archaeon]